MWIPRPSVRSLVSFCFISHLYHEPRQCLPESGRLCGVDKPKGERKARVAEKDMGHLHPLNVTNSIQGSLI